MSSDWEYWVEQQEEAQQFAALANYDRSCRSIGYWLNGMENQIWNWYPGHRAYGWMRRLHKDLQVGSQCFLAKNIYPASEREMLHISKQPPLRVMNEIVYEVTGHEGAARYDVIVLPQKDLGRLEQAAKKMVIAAKDMKEEHFAEMLGEMVISIKEEKTVKIWVFHREI